MLLSEEKLAYGVKPFARAVDLSPSLIWEAIKDGRLRSFKIGSRRLIAKKDAEEWLNSYRNTEA